jgi:predicted nucleic acid-binding protein
MAPEVFLDTNIILRHILNDHPDHSPRATALFVRIERDELAVRTSDTVIFESVFALEKLYRVPRSAIAEALLLMLAFPGIVLPGKEAYHHVFELYVTRRGLSFADCYHAILMGRLGVSDILTFDRGFNNLPGITRREP